MKRLTKRHYREQAALCLAALLAREEEAKKLEADLDNARGLNKELTAAVRRLRAERDALVAPIEREQNAIIILAVEHRAGERWAIEHGLAVHQYRICTSEVQLRGYRNRRFVKVWWPDNGSRTWDGMMRYLGYLVASAGFVEIES